MDLPDQTVARIRTWALANGNIAEVWLFGSRAKGTVRLDSDVDLGLVLLSGDAGHDWPLGNYVALGSAWCAELEVIADRHVSLEIFARSGESESEEAAAAKAAAIRVWPPGE